MSDGLPKAPAGAWARSVIPKWCFTRYEAATRLGVDPSRISQLLRDLGLSDVATVYRPVRFADGRIRRRRVLAITPTILETLMLAQLARLGRTHRREVVAP